MPISSRRAWQFPCTRSSPVALGAHRTRPGSYIRLLGPESGNADIVRIFHISLNAPKYISASRDITTGR
jgi:hypothetical protein